MPISLFLTKCSGKDVYNVEKSKVLISETVLRLDLIAFITSMELSIEQNKLTPEFHILTDSYLVEQDLELTIYLNLKGIL